MSRDDWCRRKSWTKKDQEEFYARNARSRGDDSKAQYMYLQAASLRNTGKKKLIKAAVELLEESFKNYPEYNFRAQSLDLAGTCCVDLKNQDQAIYYYQKALERQREFKGVKTNACFSFGKLVVVDGLIGMYENAEKALDDYGNPIFPSHIYMYCGIKSVISAHRGDTEKSREYAQTALQAVEVKDSGLGWGRGELGLVNNTRTKFHKIVKRLAEA